MAMDNERQVAGRAEGRVFCFVVSLPLWASVLLLSKLVWLSIFTGHALYYLSGFVVQVPYPFFLFLRHPTILYQLPKLTLDVYCLFLLFPFLLTSYISRLLAACILFFFAYNQTITSRVNETNELGPLVLVFKA